MVILVRCCDGTYSLALNSRLDDLIDAGLISAFLREGAWVATGPPPAKRDRPAAESPTRRVTAFVSSF